MVYKYIVLRKVGEINIKNYYILNLKLYNLTLDLIDYKALIIKRYLDKERAIFYKVIVYSILEEI